MYIYIIYIYIHTHTHTHTYTGGPRYNLQLHSYAPRVHYFRASQKRHACRVRKPPLVDKYFFFGFFFWGFFQVLFQIFFQRPPQNDRHVPHLEKKYSLSFVSKLSKLVWRHFVFVLCFSETTWRLLFFSETAAYFWECFHLLLYVCRQFVFLFLSAKLPPIRILLGVFPPPPLRLTPFCFSFSFSETAADPDSLGAWTLRYNHTNLRSGWGGVKETPPPRVCFWL